MIYTLGRKNLPAEANEIPNPLPAEQRRRSSSSPRPSSPLVVVLALTGILDADRLATSVVAISILASVAYFVVILGSKRITSDERSRVVAFIPMFITSAVFWSLYQQQFTVLTVYSDEQLNRNLFGWEMPVSWVQSINPVFIMILSLVFAALWTKLGDRQPSTPIKFALGVIVMGIAFLLFIPMASTVPNSAPLLGHRRRDLRVHHRRAADLPRQPVAVHEAGPARLPDPDGGVAVLVDRPGHRHGRCARRVLHRRQTQVPYFGILGGIAIAVGIVLILFTPWVKKMMKRRER